MNSIQLISLSNMLLDTNVYKEIEKLPNLFKNMLLNYRTDGVYYNIFYYLKLIDNNIKFCNKFPV